MKKVLIIILSVFLVSCSNEGNIFNYQQQWYLKDDFKDRIFIYTYEWKPTCNDIMIHAWNLMNTDGRTTWWYYFSSWTTYPSTKISIAKKFYDEQVIIEDYIDEYSFVYSKWHTWKELLKDYRWEEEVDCK
jgi:hypothetical protein